MTSWHQWYVEMLTELDAGVLLPHVLTLLVGEEHIGRETSLGGVGVLDCVGWSAESRTRRRGMQRRRVREGDNEPFLALRPFSTLAPFFAAALGMLVELVRAMLVGGLGLRSGDGNRGVMSGGMVKKC